MNFAAGRHLCKAAAATAINGDKALLFLSNTNTAAAHGVMTKRCPFCQSTRLHKISPSFGQSHQKSQFIHLKMLLIEQLSTISSAVLLQLKTVWTILNK
jgi:hypothetical protein